MLFWPPEFWPSGFFARGVWPDDARRHEVYTRSTVDGADTLVAVIPPGSPAEVTIAGAPGTELFVWARAFSRLNRPDADTVSRGKLTRFAWDDEGNLVLPVPNPPVALQLEQRAGGYILARWTHVATRQRVACSRFNVYAATGEDAISYAAAAHQVAAGGRVVEQLLGPYAHGTLVKVAVRAEGAAGVGAEEANTTVVEITADAEGPAAPAGLTVEVTSE